MATGEQVESWSEEYIDYQCCICKTNSKVISASDYCFDCQKYLCSACLSVHNTFSDKHNVLEVTEVNFQKILTERCDKHPDELIKYYCREHEALLCNTCGLLDHKKCEDLKHIIDSAEELCDDHNIHVNPKVLRSALAEVDEVITGLNGFVVNVKEKGNSYLTDLEDYTLKLMSKVKDFKAKGETDINHAQQQIISVANANLQACFITKEHISKCIWDMERSEKRKAHLFVLKKKGQRIIEKDVAMCRESEQMIKKTVFSFRTDTQTSDLSNSFGSLVINVKLYKSKRVSDITDIIECPTDTTKCGTDSYQIQRKLTAH